VSSVAGVAAGVLLLGSAPAEANVALTRVSTDPFTNTTSQHATEEEPDSFAWGSTVVTAFQVGRFNNGGASDIGWATSVNGGSTWTNGFLPGLTATSPSPDPRFERVSDASVAYDARHGTWLISSIPITATVSVPFITISRSTNGTVWTKPVDIPPPPVRSVNLDKNWTACDNTPTSPFYGTCYTEFDNNAASDLEYMSRSTDGGATWSIPVSPSGNVKGLGGQPVVQPNGTVIVPIETITGQIAAFRSTNGGNTWTKAVTVSAIRFHTVDGNLRTSPLPSAEIAHDGTVFVAWEDCRFRASCRSNDIVFSTSTDGATWSPVTRVPIDAVTTTADHFIPGLAVDPATSGVGTHLALTYYFYPVAACGNSCALTVGYLSSPDAGAHWSVPTQLAGPMSLTDIAQTTQGAMVGDYISTSFSGSTATTVFAVGAPHGGTAYDEAMFAPTTPLAVATAAQAPAASSTAGGNNGQGHGVAIQAVRRD